MPEPGDLIDAFAPLPSRCIRIVQSRQLQAIGLHDLRHSHVRAEVDQVAADTVAGVILGAG